MNDDRLRVAFGGLHPARVGELFDRHGPRGTRIGIGHGSIKTTDRVREAVGVAAGERNRQLAAAGIGVLYRGEGAYPEHLAGLPDAPDLLFVRGRIPAEPGVAVVGTRRCTAYGRRLARRYGEAIAGAGWSLISGLARGIDGAAHSGTVAAGGVGVAVLGSGIDVMYPREHRRLAVDLIANGGAVLSESPPGTPPEGWRFPPRNRIISGLAAAVVVVEAGVTGGALITAEAALQHGREVFVVPGDVDRASSEGCNLLIRDGAHPVMGPDDLLAALELVLGPVPRPDAPGAPPFDPPFDPPVDPEAKRLLEAIRRGVDTIDALAAESALPIPKLLALVGRLEAQGHLIREGTTVIG